ncbi:MAG: MarR family transcriptional regulator [Pseudomonadota bacterium]
MHIAVLTGDLIGSTELSADQISTAFTAIEAAAPISRNRGDGWQLLLTQPATALRTALRIRAALRRHDLTTRIAIASGVSTAPIPKDLNEATGPVFVASGRALDAMSKGTTLAHAAGGALAATTRLADHISTGWTQPQAAAMHLALSPDAPTRAEIGAALGKSRQAVDQALAAAGYPALSDALRLIEHE